MNTDVKPTIKNLQLTAKMEKKKKTNLILVKIYTSKKHLKKINEKIKQKKRTRDFPFDSLNSTPLNKLAVK